MDAVMTAAIAAAAAIAMAAMVAAVAVRWPQRLQWRQQLRRWRTRPQVCHGAGRLRLRCQLTAAACGALEAAICAVGRDCGRGSLALVKRLAAVAAVANTSPAHRSCCQLWMW
jgi:hypothetical protein